MIYRTVSEQKQVPFQSLGTFPMRGNVLLKAVDSALSFGYYGFDTARDYCNEQDLGYAIKSALHKYEMKREQLFLTTKIGNQQQVNYKNGLGMLDDVVNSIERLQSSYLDLLLMHWPYPGIFIDTWKLLENIPQHLVRMIGVCNYKTRHFQHLLADAEKMPVLNQMEIHPLYIDWDTIDYCRENNIEIQAYCPLGLMDKKISESDILKSLSCQYNKTISQIVLRWHLQHGFLTVPKSSLPERIRQNSDVYDFELSTSELGKIDNMNIKCKKYFESFYCPGY